MNTKGVFSSQTDEWATPQWLFDELDAEFHFDLDPCATDENHKCEVYFTKETDGLQKNWGGGQYTAIHHMDGKSANGYEKPMRKRRKREQQLSCSPRQGRTQSGFTITFTAKQKSDSSEGVCASATANMAHRFHQWL